MARKFNPYVWVTYSGNGSPLRGNEWGIRAAHERNDEILERIYIGRRFRNDTEGLEKLF